MIALCSNYFMIVIDDLSLNVRAKAVHICTVIQTSGQRYRHSNCKFADYPTSRSLDNLYDATPERRKSRIRTSSREPESTNADEAYPESPKANHNLPSFEIPEEEGLHTEVSEPMPTGLNLMEKVDFFQKKHEESKQRYDKCMLKSLNSPISLYTLTTS